MKRLLCGTVNIVVFGATFAGPAIMPMKAHADISTIRSENNAMWFSAGVSNFGYQESVTPLPDSEHGNLGSFASGVSMMSNNNLYLDLDGSVSTGDAHYNGAYLYAPSKALQGTTSETMTTIDGKIGQGVPLGSMVMVTPYVDLGFRYWNRNLGAGQAEDYQNFAATGGGMLQWAPISQLVVTGYGSLGTTFSGTMNDNSGDKFNLGSAGVYKIGGKVGFLMMPRVEVFTSIDYDHFRYAHSNVDNGYLEPGSHTEEAAYRVGMAYQFK